MSQPLIVKTSSSRSGINIANKAQGEHHASRACAEGRAGRGGIAVFSSRYPLDNDGEARPGVGDDDEPVCYAWRLSAARIAQPLSASQPDRFTAWSSFAHASIMAVQAFLGLIARRELFGVATFVVIGVALTVLAPAKQRVERASIVAA